MPTTPLVLDRFPGRVTRETRPFFQNFRGYMQSHRGKLLFAFAFGIVCSKLSVAQAAPAPLAVSNADNAWMLVSAALVLMMTGPGLALFYGGLVRRKNVLSVMMQSFAMMAIITILWAVVSYSLAFDAGTALSAGCTMCSCMTWGSRRTPTMGRRFPFRRSWSTS